MTDEEYVSERNEICRNYKEIEDRLHREFMISLNRLYQYYKKEKKEATNDL